jgi:hypothetical protein
MWSCQFPTVTSPVPQPSLITATLSKLGRFTFDMTAILPQWLTD